MDITNKKNSLPNTLIREDFKKKLKSWFENKGIDKKLELYLRSQMIVEFQNTIGLNINSARSPSLSPKLQAVRLLIADFLLQEDLLFSLSVFVSEVPFLNTLSSYTRYVKALAQPIDSISARPSKPKFSDTHLRDLFDALNLNLSLKEIHMIRTKYELSNCSSLLVSLLSMLPVLLKKYRSIDHILNKTRQRNKNYRKIMKTESTKSKQMYLLLQEAYSLIQKHKSEMNEVLQKHNECEERLTIIQKQSIDLASKENELALREKSLESRERTYEQKYLSKLKELEKKLKVIEDQEREFQNKHKKLQEEQSHLQYEKQQFQVAKSQTQITNSREVEKLEEYECRLSALQNQVLEIVKKSDKKEGIFSHTVTNNREIQCVFDTSNRSQQTENDDFINIEQYVNLVEKENALLKLGSNKQHYRINQLSSEVLALRNKLEYLESEIKIRKRLERDEEMQHVAHKLYFPRSPREIFAIPANVPASSTIPRSRRRLAFDESPHHVVLGLESSESSSNSLSATNKLTDEIVADAKNKLKELEAESEMLNHNFQNLQTVLMRNIAFAERPILSSSNLSDSSPNERRHRRTRLSRSISDLDNPNVGLLSKTRNASSNLSDFEESSPSCRTDREKSPLSPSNGRSRKTAAFSRIFQKYRQKKPTENEDRTLTDGYQKTKQHEDVETHSVQLNSEIKSMNECQRPNIELVEVNVKRDKENHFEASVDFQDTVDIQYNNHLEDEKVVNNAANIISGTSDSKQIIDRKLTEDQKSGLENSGQSESASQSNGVISVEMSNGSSSSDFWK